MKKYISIIFCIMLIYFSAIAVTASSYSDVVAGEDKNFDKALDLLDFLEITSGYEDGTFKPENILNRGEGAVLITNFLNIDSTSGKDMFSDVASDHYAYNNVYTCTQMGIINGYDDGTFRPEEQLTYNQFIKMIVAAMGYSEYADMYGGYPSGYVKMADNMKLYDGVANKGDAPVDRYSIVKIIYNALNAELLDVDNGLNNRDDTMLEKSFGLKSFEGRVNADEYYSIDGGDTAYRGAIRIDKETYTIADGLNASDYVGADVIAYRNVSSADEEIVHLYCTNKKVEKVVLSSEEIESFSDNRLTTFIENRKKSYKLSSDLKVVYNGVNETDYTENMMTFKYEDAPEYSTYGDMTLIDLNTDSVYDTVVINSYENYFVSSVDAKNGIVYDKYRKNLSLDLSGENNEVEIYDFKTKERITVTDIAVEDVLAVAKSKDDSRVVVYRTTEFIEGNIESYTEEEAVIEGTTYKISGSYNRNLGSEGFEEFTAGSNGMFYLDIHSNIAFSQVYDMAQYAFIFDAFSTEDGEDVVIKCLTEFGKVEKLNVAPKIVLRSEDSYGNAIKNEKVASNQFNPDGVSEYFRNLIYDQDNEFIGQVAKIEKNKDGNVSDVTFFECDFYNRQATFADSLQYVLTGEKYGVGFNGIFFDIKKVDGKFDLNESSVKTIDKISRNVTYNNLSLYDISSLNVARVMSIIQETSLDQQCADSSAVNKENPVMVVKSVRMALNEQGDEVYSITGFVDGKEVQINTEDEDVCDSVADSQYSVNANNPKGPLYAKDLMMGDMIQYSTNLAGSMDNFRTLFRNNDEFYGTVYGDYRTRGKIMYVPNNDTSSGVDISDRRAVTPEDSDPFDNGVNTYFTYYSGQIVDSDSSALIINPFMDFVGQSRLNEEIGGVYEYEDIEPWNKLYLMPDDAVVYKVSLEDESIEVIPYNNVKPGDFAVIRASWQKVKEIFIIE